MEETNNKTNEPEVLTVSNSKDSKNYKLKLIKNKKTVKILLYISLSLIIIGGITYLGTHLLDKNEKELEQDTTNLVEKKSEQNDTKEYDDYIDVENCKTREENYQEQLFEGKLTRLDKDLDLFEEHVQCTKNNSCEYYTAGTFKTGEFKGYTRIIALTKETGFLSHPKVDIILATKDFEKYILHVPNCNYQQLDQAHGHDAYIKKDKIISQNTLGTEHPQNIYLNEYFVLEFNSSFYTTLVDFLHTFDNTIKTNRLNTKSTNLEIFEVIPEEIGILSSNAHEDNSNIIEDITNNKLIKTRTYTLVEDSTGLKKWYDLKLVGSTEAYTDNLPKWEKKWEERFYPKPNYRSLGFNSDQISRNNIKLYETYWNYLEAGKGYGGEEYALVIDINQEELENIGYVYEKTPLYKLKNANHILNKFAYNINIGNNFSNEQFYKRHLREVPDFKEYTKNNPLLFFQDYWERWILISERDFNTNFQ